MIRLPLTHVNTAISPCLTFIFYSNSGIGTEKKEHHFIKILTITAPIILVIAAFFALQTPAKGTP